MPSAAVAMLIPPVDIGYRNLDLLGITPPISMSNAVSNTVLVNCNDTRFKTGRERIFIAFVELDTSDNKPPPPNTFIRIGLNLAGNDWTGPNGYNVNLYAGGSYPIVMTPQMGMALPSIIYPVYSRGLVYVQNAGAGQPTPQTGVFTAWGWVA